jgi:hypothetical protein
MIFAFTLFFLGMGTGVWVLKKDIEEMKKMAKNPAEVKWEIVK